MRSKLLAVAILAAGCATATQAQTPTMYSAVGIGQTSISAVVPRSQTFTLEEPTQTERRNLALIGMILMKARGLPSVN